jgi:hypothetical protein
MARFSGSATIIAAPPPRPARRAAGRLTVDPGPAPRADPGVPGGAGRGRRLAVVYDTDGPRIRLGVTWFVVVVWALVVGLEALAPLYAAAAGLAAAQAATVWRRRGGRPHVLGAAVGAALLPLAAALTTGLLGLAVLALVAIAFATAEAARRRGRGRPPAALAVTALTVRCAFPVGLAAAALVCAQRFESGAGLALVLVVSAYESGDYLIGSDARSPLEGPVAGIAAVLVVQFAIAAVTVPPFELPSALAFVVVAGITCPLGQVVGSLILPSARAPAPALRRLDSLLVLAPVWAVVVGAMAAA